MSRPTRYALALALTAAAAFGCERNQVSGGEVAPPGNINTGGGPLPGTGTGASGATPSANHDLTRQTGSAQAGWTSDAWHSAQGRDDPRDGGVYPGAGMNDGGGNPTTRP